MLKVKKLNIALLVLMFVFYLNLSGLMAADICPGPFSTLTESWQYDESWIFKWDPNNPEEIDQNSSVFISVIGGIPPYTWSVSGNGFSLSEDETQGLSNTLNADDTACGSATITVTDDYGAPVTGCVRCTNGVWRKKNENCVLSGSGIWNGAGGYFELIQGFQRQIHHCKKFGGSLECYDPAWPQIWENCDTGNHDYCHETDRCVGCINAWPLCECIQTGTPPPHFVYMCWCTRLLEYYEWECP